MTNADVLIMGATASGLAVASVFRKQGFTCIIVESRSYPAAVSVGAFHSDGKACEVLPGTEDGIRFKEFLMRRGVIASQTGESLGMLVPAVCEQMRIESIPCAFLSRLVSMRKATVWEADVYGPGGIHKIRAKYFIDTTSQMDSRAVWNVSSPRLQSARMNAMVIGKAGDGIPCGVRGRYPDEAYVGYALDRPMRTDEAARYFMSCWHARGARERDWRVVSIANEIDWIPAERKRVLDDCAWWLPSAAEPNAVASYDAGASFAYKLEELGGAGK